MLAIKKFTVPMLLVAAVGTASPACAADDDLMQQVEQMRAEIAAQQRQLQAQQQQLQKLENRVSAQAMGPSWLRSTRGAGETAIAAAPLNAPQASQAQASQAPVGVAPTEVKERPEVAVLSDVGGVLTPKGHLTIEPSFEYDNQQFNQLFFSGLEVVNAVFVGGLNATSARRNTLTAALSGRYGITDRLEASFKLPYVYRSDRLAEGPVNTNTLNTDVSGHDIGDVEFGLHYQLNAPTDGSAYYVANFRVKTDSGTGPFNVPYNVTGQQQVLPTGSGFWAFEPSLTFLYPNDPVVLFGNLGYTYNLGSTFNQTIAGQTFGNVKPGDVLRASGGMGFSINDRISLSLGYEHDFVLATEEIVNGAKSSTEQLQIGSFIVGGSYAFSPDMTGNFNVALGATRDAPDVRLMFTLPITFDLLK